MVLKRRLEEEIHFGRYSLFVFDQIYLKFNSVQLKLRCDDIEETKKYFGASEIVSVELQICIWLDHFFA